MINCIINKEMIVIAIIVSVLIIMVISTIPIRDQLKKVRKADNEKLTKAINKLAKNMGVKKKIDAYLYADMNACAGRSHSFFGKRYVCLGLPFAYLFSEEQIYCILAHEISHIFSNDNAASTIEAIIETQLITIASILNNSKSSIKNTKLYVFYLFSYVVGKIFGSIACWIYYFIVLVNSNNKNKREYFADILAAKECGKGRYKDLLSLFGFIDYANNRMNEIEHVFPIYEKALNKLKMDYSKMNEESNEIVLPEIDSISHPSAKKRYQVISALCAEKMYIDNDVLMNLRDLKMAITTNLKDYFISVY